MGSAAEEVVELKANFADLKSIIGKQEIRVQYLETKTGQLFVSYILVQAFILSSISHTSSVSLSKKWWIPIALLLSASIIFWLTIATTISAWLRAQYELDLSFIEKQIVYHRMYLVQKGLKQSAKSSGGSAYQQLKPDLVSLYLRYMYVSVIVSALLAFTVLMLYACYTILHDAPARI